MSKKIFLTALRKRKKVLLWPDWERKATGFSWQLDFDVHLGIGLTYTYKMKDPEGTKQECAAVGSEAPDSI